MFELLGSLWQRIKFTLMLTRGDDIVARTLRRRAGENRRGDLREAERLHLAPQKADHFGAEKNIIMHTRITQIKEAVFQPHLLTRISGILHVKWQIRHAWAQHLQRVGQHFQPSCRDFGVDRFFIPSNDFSGNGNRRFPVKILQQSVIMHDYLRHAILIPQVEKSHAAVIADRIHPSG